jgi:hypothetical protein
VAAITGLLLQAAPCLLSSGGVDASTARIRLRNLLIGGALPLSSAVPDNTFGAGRADALASIQKTLPVLGAARVTVSGNTATGASLSASQVGFSDPDQCALTRMSWTGGCGTSPGSALNCPFGNTSLSVRASNNGVTFSPASDLQITVTNFSMTATPGNVTVASGQTAAFSATVNAQGGAFTAPVALACTNLPAGTSCTFNPPSVTPGAGSSSSTVTITTTARTSLSGVAGGNIPMLCAFLVVAMLTLAAADPGESRRRLATALLVMFAVCLTVQSGCGGTTSSSSSTSTSSNSPAAPSIAIAPSTVSFGAQTVQTTSAPQTVTVTNSGTPALAIAGISITGDFAQTNTCPSSLASGGGCAIALTFTPAAAGSRSGSLTIADNGAGSPHTVALSGTGQAANSGASGVTPAGTYVIGITGQAGSLARSTSVTLVVQ